MSSRNEYRVQYYLGSVANGNLTPNEKWQITIMNSKIVNDVPENNLWHLYLAPFIKIIKRLYGIVLGKQKKFMLVVGDIEQKKISLLQRKGIDSVFVHDYNLSSFQSQLKFCFVKNRLVEWPNDGVLLRSLNKERHWGYLKERPIDTLPFPNKKSIAVWRGSTTGDFKMLANRFQLVRQWFRMNPMVDVGFTNIVQDPKNYGEFFQKNDISGYRCSEMSPSKLLEYKYIISVRGNDKDSGLNWKLASRSVVFMARPTVNSWLMESELIPNVHYVLLKDDFSDLAEKVQWANENINLMKQISRNARKYMKRFEDVSNERSIEMEVIKRYFKYTQG